MCETAARASRRKGVFVGNIALLCSVCVVGVTIVAGAGAAVLRRRLLDHEAAVAADLSALLASLLPVAGLRGTSPGEGRRDGMTSGSVPPRDVVRLILYGAHGSVLWSDDPALIGSPLRPRAGLDDALRGRLRIDIVRPDPEERRWAPGSDRLEAIYIPVRFEAGGPVVGVLNVYRRPSAFLAVLDRSLALVWLVGVGGGAILYAAISTLERRSARRAARSRPAGPGEGARESRPWQASRTFKRVAPSIREPLAPDPLPALASRWLSRTVVILDGRGVVIFVSPEGQDMLGHRCDDVVGTSVRRYWARGAREFRSLRGRLAAGCHVEGYDTEVWAADGRRRRVNVSASLISGCQGRVTAVVAVFTDPCAYHLACDEMVRGERLAAAGLLAAGIAHEIRNPLTCISSLGQMLSRVSKEPAMRRGLADIQLHAQRIRQIVEDLASVACPRPFQISECTVEEIVQTAVRLARHNPTARSIRIDVRLRAPVPRVRAAADHLLQVFLNLILNAADAGGDLTVTVAGTGSGVRVVFEDTGRGMPAEQLQRLFEPFATTRGGEGHLGLGLFVAGQIVHRHGGTIAVESRVGRGSTFAVVLPVERPARVAEARG